MASRIDRVEKEFVLTEAWKAGTSFRLLGRGVSQVATLHAYDRDRLSFALPASPGPSFSLGEHLSVLFEFRGQNIAFGAEVRRARAGQLELALPPTIYRDLARRWPRVPRPALEAELVIPGASLRLDCPECLDYSELEPPADAEAVESLHELIERFREAVPSLASDGRVIMFKNGRLPADPAEEMAARIGKLLYVPSTLSGLPVADPYPEHRLITKAMAEEYEGLAALAGGSPLAAYLAERSAGGLKSALWCPIVYYRYTVGLVHVANGPDRPRALDFGAVDFAWDFSRRLAWLLKRHGYFPNQDESRGAARAEILDASPSGLLVSLGSGAPPLRPGARLDLRLQAAETRIECRARIARRIFDGAGPRYGLAFEGLNSEAEERLALGLYGETAGLSLGRGA